MMNNNVKFGALAMAAVALASCSTDEVIESGMTNPKEIAFSATSELTTRAQQSYCNTNLPDKFQVLAKYNANNDIYFKEQTATKNGDVWTLENKAYWPEEALDFVAWKNASNCDYNNGQPKFSNFQPASQAGEQLDFIYAVTLGKSEGQVKLNFRHALSQVVFRADNSSDLKIEIKGVKVGKIHSMGDFTLPALGTDKNYDNHGNTTNGTEANVENQGTWEGVQESALEDYTVTFNAKDIKEDIVWLTDVNHNNGGDLSMILLPQTADAWVPTPGDADFNGAYFALNVVMTNSDGKQVYEGEACVPVSIEWEQGYRYIYTFHFTDGSNGGYTPDPDDPKPILANISFDLYTDDFIPADKDKDIDTDPDPAPETHKVTFSIPAINYETSVEVEEGDNATFTIPTTEPTKEGYDFKGWSSTESAEEVEYTGGQTIDTAGDLTLYPVWEAQDVTYTVKFDMWGGSHDLIKDITVDAKYGETKEITIPKYRPTGKDYANFLGWSLTPQTEVLPEGETLPEGDFKNGDIIEVSQDMTLYAVYVQTVDAVGGGGSGNDSEAD